MSTYSVQIVAGTFVTRRIEIDAESPELARKAAVKKADKENSEGAEHRWQIASTGHYEDVLVDPACLSGFSTDEIKEIR